MKIIDTLKVWTVSFRHKVESMSNVASIIKLFHVLGLSVMPEEPLYRSFLAFPSLLGDSLGGLRINWTDSGN